jgi:4-hydroxy-tetrahydrodipicolinate synthase
MKKLEGIVVPLLTPFTEADDRFDPAAYRRLIDFVIGAGTQAIIANAATSEFYALDDAERAKAAEIAVEHARGRTPVLVGAGAAATRDSVRWAKHAKSIGADGLLIMPPYYFKPTIDAVVRHFAAVSDAVDLPIMVYNAPYAQNLLLLPEDIDRLARNANVPWVKLTTGVLDHVTRLRKTMGNRIAIFEGVDMLAFASMAMGSVGWVAGTANMIPEFAVELWRLTHIAGDMRAARALNDRIDPIQRMATTPAIYGSWIKEVCRLRGLALGTARNPGDPLNAEQIRLAREYAAELGLVGLATALAKVA